MEFELDSESTEPQINGCQVSVVKCRVSSINLAHTLPAQLHQVKLEVISGPVLLDGFIVENHPSLTLNRTGSAIMVLATLIGLWFLWKQRQKP